MFNNSKYTRWYFSIVDSAKNREIPNCYTEKHHIIPKCFSNDNSKENLVVLTAKEHFICHLLLTKMVITPTQRKSMIFAFHCMRFNKKSAHFRYIGSQDYSKLKEERSQFLRQTKMSQETKDKISKGNTGKIRTQEAKDKVSQANKGRVSVFKGRTHSDQTKEILKNKRLGIKTSEQTKQKMSQTRKSLPSTFSYGAEHNKKISDAQRANGKYGNNYIVSFTNGETLEITGIWDFVKEYNFPINTIRTLVDRNGETVKQGKCKGMTISLKNN